MADSHTLQETQTIGIHDVLKGLQSIMGHFQTWSAICKFSNVTESFFNRTAMGRARFLLYTGFFFFFFLSVTRPKPQLGHTLQETQTIGIHDVLKGLQSIMGHFQTWSAICKFSNVTESFFNRTAMGRARFLLYTGFFFCIFFVGDQTQTSAQPNRDRDF